MVHLYYIIELLFKFTLKASVSFFYKEQAALMGCYRDVDILVLLLKYLPCKYVWKRMLCIYKNVKEISKGISMH